MQNGGKASWGIKISDLLRSTRSYRNTSNLHSDFEKNRKKFPQRVDTGQWAQSRTTRAKTGFQGPSLASSAVGTTWKTQTATLGILGLQRPTLRLKPSAVGKKGNFLIFWEIEIDVYLIENDKTDVCGKKYTRWAYMRCKWEYQGLWRKIQINFWICSLCEGAKILLRRNYH